MKTSTTVVWITHIVRRGRSAHREAREQREGQVHRLKLIKRQMYGRGSFTLLRKRVLHRAETKRRKLRAQEQWRSLGRKPADQAALAS